MYICFLQWERKGEFVGRLLGTAVVLVKSLLMCGSEEDKLIWENLSDFPRVTWLIWSMAGTGNLVTWPKSGPFYYPTQTYRFSSNDSAWNQGTAHLGLNLGLNQIPIFRGGGEKFMFKPSDLKREKKKKRGNDKERKKATTRLSRIWRIPETVSGFLPLCNEAAVSFPSANVATY